MNRLKEDIADYSRNSLVAAATAFDHRFKKLGFIDSITASKIHDSIDELVLKISTSQPSENVGNQNIANIPKGMDSYMNVEPETSSEHDNEWQKFISSKVTKDESKNDPLQ